MKKSTPILSRIFSSNIVYRYTFVTLALIIAAISYNVFLKPFSIVTGGTNGLAVLLEHFLNINSALIIFLLYFIFLILSFIFLGKEETIATAYITFIYPLLVYFTEDLTYIIKPDNYLLAAFFAGVLSGVANGVIFKVGFNTGGVGVCSKIIFKYIKIPISTANFLVNCTIVLAGAFSFGFAVVLYAVVVLVINKIISEKILVGISAGKAFYIISDKYLEISAFLTDYLKHDVTMFDTIGKYTNVKNKMLMVVIPTEEYYVLKESILEIDSKAFVFIADSYEVLGEDRSISTYLE